MFAELAGMVFSDPRILDGMPVIAGTVVPIKTLFDYRRAGLPLYEFLVDFPSVRRAQAKRLWAWLAKQDEAAIECLLSGPLPPPVRAALRQSYDAHAQHVR